MTNQPFYSYDPDFVPPPGETLLELLEERQMTQSELAQRMGRPIKTINEIVRGKKQLTPETALQLERVLGTPARLWLKMEQQYREHLARRADNNMLQAQQHWVTHFPIAQMQTFGWLQKKIEGTELLIALLQFLGIAEPASWEDIWAQCLVDFRKSNAYASNPYALSAWLRQGEIAGNDIQCAPYSKSGFTQLLHGELRQLTCEPPEVFEPKMVALCAAVGVAVTFVPQIDGARVSGAARWLHKDKALIQLSLRYKMNDHFWFSFFHEAGHIVCHSKRTLFINIENAAETQKEQEANQFARETLIPSNQYAAFVRAQPRGRFSIKAVKAFAKRVGIAPGIVVGRLQHDGHVPYTHLNGLKEKIDWPTA